MDCVVDVYPLYVSEQRHLSAIIPAGLTSGLIPLMFVSTTGNRRSTEMLFPWNGLYALLEPSVRPALHLARVNCQTQKVVCQHFHEFQFPTIRLIRRSHQTVIYQVRALRSSRFDQCISSL